MSGLPLTTTKELPISSYILNTYFNTLSSKEINELNTDLTEERAALIVNNLVPFVSSKSMNFAVLLGVAFDVVHPDKDRRRFREAVKFLLNTGNQGDETFVLSVDPEFSIMPVGFDKVRTIIKCISTMLEVNISITLHEDSRVDWLQYTSLDEATKKDLSKYKVLKFTLTDTVTGKSGVFYFMFLKYPLSSAYSPTPFSKRENLLNIHEGAKTIDTYVGDKLCQYTDDSFYKAIERVATQPTVKTVYFASAASAHTDNPIYRNTKAYLPEEKIYEFRSTGYWYVDNRYLQGICDVLTLMKKISGSGAAGAGAGAGKPVFFIILDSKQPTFSHPSVHITYNSKNAKSPYAVPFDSTTTFDLSNPFIRYPKGNLPPITSTSGGKRKTNTRKRKTRKQKSKDTKRK